MVLQNIWVENFVVLINLVNIVLDVEKELEENPIPVQNSSNNLGFVFIIKKVSFAVL